MMPNMPAAPALALVSLVIRFYKLLKYFSLLFLTWLRLIFQHKQKEWQKTSRPGDGHDLEKQHTFLSTHTYPYQVVDSGLAE